MALGNDMEAIRAQVKRNLPAVLKKSDEELLADIGQIALSQTLFDAQNKITVNTLTKAGSDYVRKASFSAKVKSVVCNNKDIIGEKLTVTNVAALVSVLLPAFGIAGIVPVAVLSLAVFIIRIGLNEYCRGFKVVEV